MKKKDKPTYEIFEILEPIKSPSSDNEKIEYIKNLILSLSKKDDKMIIDSIFNKFKIKFTVLDNLIHIDKDTDRVIFYIDLEMIINSIYQPNASNEIVNYEDEQFVRANIVSNIINIAQHYRLYISKLGFDSRCILYWSYPINLNNDYINSKYIENYRKFYNDSLVCISSSYIINIINEVYSQMSTIVDYIYHVYLVNHNTIESSMIPFIIDKEVYKQDNLKDLNILISNYQYNLQYISNGFNILNPKKDKSYIINKDNYHETLKNKFNIKKSIGVPDKFIPFMISLLGDTFRNIPKIKGFTPSSIIKLINKSIDEYLITENTISIDMLKQLLNEKYHDSFYKNYHVTNLELQYNDLTPSDIYSITKQIVDKFDEQAIDILNQRYFQRCQIMNIDTLYKKIQDKIYNPVKKSVFDKLGE